MHTYLCTYCAKGLGGSTRNGVEWVVLAEKAVEWH